MIFIRQNYPILILTILAIVFFFIYSYLPLSQIIWQTETNTVSSFKYNTPDEVINSFFSSHYARTGDLYYLEPLDNFMHRVIFPRWAFVIDTKITPGNFLGLDLIYGNLAKLFSSVAIPFFTPFFAIIGIFFFYLLIKKIFDQRVAFISALLCFIFPSFWYYASRTMFHNVLFLCLLIIGLYFLLQFLDSQTKRSAWFNSILTGLFFGLSLIIRTSEIVWVAILVLTVLIFNWQKLKNLWPYLILSLVIFSAVFIPIFYHNQILYQNYFSTGYPLTTVSTNLESNKVGEISFWRALILPFGFHPRVMFTHVLAKYLLPLFWPWLALIFLGFIVLLKSRPTQLQKMFLVSLFIVSCYLFIFYGSWFFIDSAIPGLVSLGSSYVRYFLPAFILSLPLISFLFVKLASLKLSKPKKILVSCFLFFVSCLLFLVSCRQVYFQTSESLFNIKNQLIQYQQQNQQISQLTQPQDLILVSESADKILFPERRHLIVPQNGVEWLELKNILPYKTVYYFYHTNACLNSLNQLKFEPQGLQITNPIPIYPQGYLFEVKLK